MKPHLSNTNNPVDFPKTETKINKKIEQLAEECWVHTNKPLFGAKSPHWEFDRQKFAELIVRECANLADEPTSLPYESYGEKIKNYFGVEE